MELGNGFRSRPGDQRGFVHKKLLGLVSAGAGIASRLGVPFASDVGRIASSLRGQQKQSATIQKFDLVPSIVPPALVLGGRRGGGFAPFGNGVPTGPCRDPALVRSPVDGHCVAPGSPHFRQHFGAQVGGAGVPVGDAVMGRYGAALTPGSMIIDRAVCLRGMQLADDGLCYSKSQISNKQRMWPAGRKPLLSGGDMRAISIAARAGRRLEGATKRLQRLGMMKKPASRRAIAPHQHAKQIAAVSVA